MRPPTWSSRFVPAISIVALGAALALGGPASAADEKAHVWKLPVFLAQGLQIDKETKATEEILKKADVQCIDAECKKHVAECRKALPNCTLVPSPESVHEDEVENN